MALVTDTLTYTGAYRPFERPPEGRSLNSLIPRGVRRFTISTVTAVKPVNDQIQTFISATLPLNFAYILRSFTLEMSDTRATDWERFVMLRIAESGQGAFADNGLVPLELFGASAAPVGARLVASPADVSNFQGPFWSLKGRTVVFRAELVNMTTTVTLGGSLISHVEFYEYDLTQAQRHYINTAIPVLSR